MAEAVAQGLITAWDHFELFGGDEGRSPTPLFNEAFYLQQNPDVAAAIEQGIISSAAQHFALFGANEPRAINPVINLGQYINANPDIAEAASNGLIDAFQHLLQFGVNEGRPLGNGVSLSDFSADPGFTPGTQGGVQALLRVEAVAPFLPTFERPAGWTPPANTPIPVDFVPPAGSGVQLVIPPEVVVPDDVELPEDVFVPVTPPVTPPSTGGGGTTPTFTVTESNGIVTFGGTATGDITVTFTDHTAAFVRGNTNGSATVENLHTKTINLAETQALLLTSEQISTHTITSTGDGKVKVDFVDQEQATLTGAGGTNISNLALSLQDSAVSLPNIQEQNLLVYPEGSNNTSLKTLSIQASGTSSLDLGNPIIDDPIGYFLKNVNVQGGLAEDSLSIRTLYFGSENTIFNSTAYNGNVNLEAYVYNGTTNNFNWKIEFGSGDDSLVLNKDGTGNYPGISGSVIAGGDGTDTLVLDKDVYTNWANPDATYIDLTKNPVTGFEVLKTEAVDGRAYQATLLGNNFSKLTLTGDGNVTGTNATGFSTIDASAVVGSLDITTGGAGETITAALGGGTVDAGAGNDTIIFGVDTTVTGGANDDVFVISAVAGTRQPTKQLIITDYGTGSDIIDLTKVSNLKLNGDDGDRLEIHQGGQTGGSWGDQAQGTTSDILVQLSGGSGAQLIVNDAYNSGKTIKFKITESQSGLGGGDTVKDFLVNIVEGGIINASTHADGAIMSGGGGSQTLISGSGNDIMQGGSGNDIFQFESDSGVDVIMDYGNGTDVIKVASSGVWVKSGTIDSITELKDSGAYNAIGNQLISFLGDNSGSTAISLFENEGNAIILIGSSTYETTILTTADPG